MDCHADVFRKLPQQNGRKVAALVIGNGGIPSIRMRELLMGTPLAFLKEAKIFENRNDFAWLQNGDVAQVF